jgi:hypothetical protein
MSFTNGENTLVSYNDGNTEASEFLNDYETTTVDHIYLEEEDLNLYTCTLTVVNPDFTTTTVTATSLISGKMACAYARDKLLSASID